MAAGADDAGGGLPQLEFETWPSQILWLAITLVALYFILNRLVLPRVAATLEERRDTIAGDLDMAAEYDRKAIDAEKSYKAALDTARAEARKIADKTQAEIKERLNAAIADADLRIEAKASESAQKIAAIRAEAGQRAAEVAEETAFALVGKLGGAQADPNAVRTAVTDALAQR